MKIKIVIIMLVFLAVLSIVSTSTMAAEVPGIPIGFTVTADDGYVMLAWSEPSHDGGSAITGYRIYYGMVADGLSILDDVTALTYNHTGLTNGNTYYYAVSALNAEGEGEKTEIIEATPESSTPLIEEITVGDWENIHTIYVGEGVYFNLVGGTQTMIVESVTPTHAIISVSWETQSLIMSEGDSEIIDVNGDGKDDFKINCITITSDPAEGFPQTVKFSFTTKNLEGSSEDGTPGFELWTLLVAGMLVFSIIFIFRSRR